MGLAASSGMVTLLLCWAGLSVVCCLSLAAAAARSQPTAATVPAIDSPNASAFEEQDTSALNAGLEACR